MVVNKGGKTGRMVLMAVAVAAMTGTVADASAANVKRLLHKAAVDILFDVPEGRKIALRPFLDRETALPKDVADTLYNDLFDAFFKASGGAHVFVDRTNLLKIQNSREEFYVSDLEQLLAAARADVEIICNPTPHPKGVTLACSATDLHETTTLGRAQFMLPVDARTAGAQPYALAISALGQTLAAQAPDLTRIERIVIRDHNHGTQTDLGAWLGAQLSADIQSRTTAAQAAALAEYERQSALNDAADAPDTSRQSYRLKGTLYQLDGDTYQLLAMLENDGQTKAKASTKISAASLPEKIAPERAASDRVYRAVGEAVLSPKLDRDAALRAARNLARARVVAQALGLPGPAVNLIRSEADAAHVLTQSLARGIPVEERFIDAEPSQDNGRLAVELRARVLPVGQTLRPAVNARLNKSAFRALEPILIDLSSEATAFLGIYAWGADNRVVRLYPSPQAPTLAVEPDRPLLLPSPGQGDILSMPLPIADNPEDHEAIIVIAGTAPQDFAALAPMAGENLSKTMAASVDGSQFFNALGKTDLSRMSVTILPYQVRR